ncbi:tail fiber protein [Methylophilales phage Melnitz-1 EXVC043M]|nr:tail fiber protein [Methylophilales phage Melnitz-1 EXVC043M]
MATISNIFINQHADFSTNVTISDSNGSALDLTSYTALAQVRKTYESTSATSFTATFDSDRTTGKITLSLTDTQTAALESGRYVYDLLITGVSGDKTRVVEGIATVNPSVSRS